MTDALGCRCPADCWCHGRRHDTLHDNTIVRVPKDEMDLDKWDAHEAACGALGTDR